MKGLRQRSCENNESSDSTRCYHRNFKGTFQKHVNVFFQNTCAMRRYIGRGPWYVSSTIFPLVKINVPSSPNSSSPQSLVLNSGPPGGTRPSPNSRHITRIPLPFLWWISRFSFLAIVAWWTRNSMDTWDEHEMDQMSVVTAAFASNTFRR